MGGVLKKGDLQNHGFQYLKMVKWSFITLTWMIWGYPNDLGHLHMLHSRPWSPCPSPSPSCPRWSWLHGSRSKHRWCWRDIPSWQQSRSPAPAKSQVPPGPWINIPWMINIYKHHLFIQFEKWHVDWFGAHASTSRSSNSYSCCWSVWLGGISCFTSSSEFAHEGRNGLRVCTWSSRLCVWLQVGRVIIVYDK